MGGSTMSFSEQESKLSKFAQLVAAVAINFRLYYLLAVFFLALAAISAAGSYFLPDFPLFGTVFNLRNAGICFLLGLLYGVIGLFSYVANRLGIISRPRDRYDDMIQYRFSDLRGKIDELQGKIEKVEKTSSAEL